MNKRSRSTLFLIEQLIVVAVFAICSAACVRILTYAFFTARGSKDVSSALLVAESAAETYKAFTGDISKVAETLGGDYDMTESGASAIVYYDKQWQVCVVYEADYILRMINGKQETAFQSPLLVEITVEKITGEQLLAFTAAARDF